MARETMAQYLLFVEYITLLPQPIRLILVSIASLVLLLVSTRIYTTIRYRRALSQHLSPLKTERALPPPHIPYTIPFLGSAISFLSPPKPGQFFTELVKYHPRETGACTLLLGGQETHILFSPTAVQALFKAKSTSRDDFNYQALQNSFGVSRDDCAKFYGTDMHLRKKVFENVELDPNHLAEKIAHEKLLRTDAVNDITSEFVNTLGRFVDNELVQEGETLETGFFSWLRSPLFVGSVFALMGSRLLEVYPSLEHDFFEFDTMILSLFFGLPKALTPTCYRTRDRTIDGILKWHEMMEKEGSLPADPDGDVAWEPDWGNRLNRARQYFYRDVGMSKRGRASLDLGLLFALLSNAVPTTGWVIMHLLNPTGDKTLLPRVMDELQTARREDGSLDIPTLVSLPLLQSIFQETLRLYTDVLVTRTILEDMTLPNEGKGNILMKKGSVVIAPSWLGHYDGEVWGSDTHRYDTFYAERFLTTNAQGKKTFTMNGTNGKLFPFGGGKSMCPGRVFAKQEVFASVALILLNFEFEVLGFVDVKGKPSGEFPGLKDAYSGSGVMGMDGDIRVKIKRRNH
jgi:cytochrome P450